MLELMGAFGYTKEFPAAIRALEFIRKNPGTGRPLVGAAGE